LSTVLTFQDPLGDALPMLARSYLSTSYLTSAALFAKRAYAIETSEVVQAGRIGQIELQDHRACASAAIIMSALGLEAFVNELFADCEATGAGNRFGLSGEQAATLAKIWRESPGKSGGRRGPYQIEFPKKPALEKYRRVLKELGRGKFSGNSAPVKAMQTLIDLRHALAHYKLAIHRVGKGSEQRALSQLEQDLQRCFPDHTTTEHNPMTGANNAYFPDRVLGHAVAEWSVQTAVGFLEHFRERLSVTPQPGSPWPTQVMLMTR
jgi:hypothetical protein